MTLRKRNPNSLPKRTFKGRNSVSPLPRWVVNWLTTLAVLYGMAVYGLPMFGITALTPEGIGFQRVVKSDEPDLYFGEVVPTPTYAIAPSFYASSAGQELAVAQTQVAYQSLLLLITPTVTPVPMATFDPYANYPLSNHKFSFYDPMIGKDKPEIRYINCGDWNDVTQYCDSALRNGERWEDNYFIAAACPYDLYMAGAHFRVISPDWLVALFPNGFTCKDTGELVTGLFIDFLIPWRSMPMPYESTPWATPITLQRIR